MRVRSAVAPFVLALLAVASPAIGVHGSGDPVPIPGGLQIPNGPLLHLLLPGPTELGYMGPAVDPSVITNFNGFTSLAYLTGSAVGSDGVTYNMEVDVRVYQGTYVSCDGTHHRGTFGFV